MGVAQRLLGYLQVVSADVGVERGQAERGGIAAGARRRDVELAIGGYLDGAFQPGECVP